MLFETISGVTAARFDPEAAKDLHSNWTAWSSELPRGHRRDLRRSLPLTRFLRPCAIVGNVS